MTRTIILMTFALTLAACDGFYGNASDTAYDTGTSNSGGGSY